MRCLAFLGDFFLFSSSLTLESGYGCLNSPTLHQLQNADRELGCTDSHGFIGESSLFFLLGHKDSDDHSSNAFSVSQFPLLSADELQNLHALFLKKTSPENPKIPELSPADGLQVVLAGSERPINLYRLFGELFSYPLSIHLPNPLFPLATFRSSPRCVSFASLLWSID